MNAYFEKDKELYIEILKKDYKFHSVINILRRENYYGSIRK